jgi:dTDP-4-dehydrorhamnose 3,5-epimerase
MQVRHTKLPGVLILELNAYGDERGFFRELFREDHYTSLGIHANFVQQNHSRSSKNVLRGMHYQLKHPQGKLVSVMRGAIWDVIADINPASPTFGQWIAEELSDQNHCQIYIPPGYAHGFITLSEQMDLLYACTDYYNPADSYTVNWQDPTLNIVWPNTDAILSENDKAGSFLTQLSAEQLPKNIVLP